MYQDCIGYNLLDLFDVALCQANRGDKMVVRICLGIGHLGIVGTWCCPNCFDTIQDCRRCTLFYRPCCQTKCTCQLHKFRRTFDRCCIHFCCREHMKNVHLLEQWNRMDILYRMCSHSAHSCISQEGMFHKNIGSGWTCRKISLEDSRTSFLEHSRTLRRRGTGWCPCIFQIICTMCKSTRCG